METVELIEKLRQEKKILTEKFTVEEIGVFGSYARNTQTESSDIDLLIKLREPRFMNLAGLLNYLEAKLKKHIDITTKHKYLTPRFLKRIEKDIIYV